ncbi:MAG: hypothetical protein NTV21_08425 [Planctomycetota bacterium]|nr:hypothetical protein [Planctomycetota bacterium]
MNLSFPFELAWPTSGYVALYLVTLLMHALFMSYVVGGALAVAFVRLHGVRENGPVTRTFIDWLPFALSAAITAGVAPLLFVQILYQREFYTANLLSFHRWMSILPVLIGAFYLLYLLKARPHARRLSAAVASAVAFSVIFVAWSWVENHMLSLNPDVWVKQYESGAMAYRDPAVFLRLAFWVALALPTACWLVTLQMRFGASGTEPEEALFASRKLARVALGFLVVAAALAPFVLRGTLSLSPVDETHLDGADLPYFALAAVGLLFTLGGWLRLQHLPRLSGLCVVLGSLGLALTWWGVLCARELIRLARLDLDTLTQRHAELATSSGLVVFLVFAVLALLVTAWIFRRVARSLRQSK